MEQGEEEGQTRELQLEREVAAAPGMASRSQSVPGSYSESTLLLLFLELMVTQEIPHWVAI